MANIMNDPHERDSFYENFEFYDDISGKQLDKELAVAARKLEMDFFRNMGVYANIAREEA